MSRERGAPVTQRTLLDVRLHLLDRQIRDRDGIAVGVVDDVEIEIADSGPPRVSAILSGRALMYRLIGGGPHVGELDRIPLGRVRDIDVAVTLDESQEELEMAWPERWCRDHIIARLPGSGEHDRQ